MKCPRLGDELPQNKADFGESSDATPFIEFRLPHNLELVAKPVRRGFRSVSRSIKSEALSGDRLYRKLVARHGYGSAGASPARSNRP